MLIPGKQFRTWSPRLRSTNPPCWQSTEIIRSLRRGAEELLWSLDSCDLQELVQKLDGFKLIEVFFSIFYIPVFHPSMGRWPPVSSDVGDLPWIQAIVLSCLQIKSINCLCIDTCTLDLYRSSKLSKKLSARLPNYRVRMGFGLHSGWAIEAPIALFENEVYQKWQFYSGHIIIKHQFWGYLFHLVPYLERNPHFCLQSLGGWL